MDLDPRWLTALDTIGALKTPQLLELSGVGNPEILQKHGIDTILDLPGVGENLRKSRNFYGNKPLNYLCRGSYPIASHGRGNGRL